jgi:hypothetical protein
MDWHGLWDTPATDEGFNLERNKTASLLSYFLPLISGAIPHFKLR